MVEFHASQGCHERKLKSMTRAEKSRLQVTEA
jgi:hypothetical protein